MSKVPIEILYSILASVGGAAKYLTEYLHNGIFNWKNFIAQLLVSGFSGLMFAKFGSIMGLSDQAGFVFAGLGGFIGTRALDFMEEFIKRKIQ